MDTNNGHNYLDFEIRVNNNFSNNIKHNNLFQTNVYDNVDLFQVYLSNIPVENRQHYNCNACRRFINRYGGLVAIDENGNIHSVLWDSNVPEFFKKSVLEMKKLVESSNVTGMFISSKPVIGVVNDNSGWTHLHGVIPLNKVFNSSYKTSGQEVAEKLEEYKMLESALGEYNFETSEKAYRLLKSGTFYRYDRVLPIAEWFFELHKTIKNYKSYEPKYNNLVWLAVSKAPSGFCHVKSTMIGSLLQDIVDGYSVSSISERFEQKMNPLNYQRSQVDPTVGNIQQAEKLVEKLGIANSLKRRYAKFEEIPFFIWKDREYAKKEFINNGVFSSVKPKEKNISNNTTTVLPKTVMTWVKFVKTVLPDADSIELIPNNSRFMALVNAVDETSPNMFQWNNRFSWYYHSGVDANIKERVINAGGKYENNEIRCSLIWEGHTDLDLHWELNKPNHHIYYGNKRINMGYLDVDANGGYAQTTEPVENIRWSYNAPVGHYQFYVHNFCERGNGYTPFKVELEINGKIYTYSDVAVGRGWQKVVFDFEYDRNKNVKFTRNNLGRETNSMWNVSNSDYVKVKGITTSPNLWSSNPNERAGNHVFFILENCKDESQGKGRGFFVEMLNPELREIRKTLESYTKNTPIEDAEDADACGVGYSEGEWGLTLKVHSGNSVQLVEIDRMD